MIGAIIANYNYGQWISNAIDSCHNQTLKTVPIVVDDCSTDSSVQIIRKHFHNLQKISTISYGVQYAVEIYEDGILVIGEENTGPSQARNVAIELCKNDFSAFQILDADDSMMPNKVETLLNHMRNDVGVVYADYDIFDETNKTLIREFKEPFSPTRLLQDCIVHSGALIKTATLLEVKQRYGYYYHPSLRCAEDYNLWISIMKLGWKIIHVPESLTLVKNHNNNSTNSVSKQKWNECLQLIREIHG